MQTTIHPRVAPTTAICSSCGATYELRSTRAGELRLDVCAACHPAYTGVARAATTGTRVERFERRRARARR